MKSCEYCGSMFDLGVDHVVPVSTMFSGRRSGTMKGYGETVVCCRECNSLLGNKRYHTRYARALYLVECYANRLQHYSEDDQAYILDKLKTCIINYESFLMDQLDKDASADEDLSRDDELREVMVDGVDVDQKTEASQLNKITEKGVVDLADLVGMSLSDIDEVGDGVQISDLFSKNFDGSKFLIQVLIRRLKKANSGRLATFRDHIFKDNPDVFSVSTKSKLSEDDGQLFFVSLVLHADIAIEDRREIHAMASWFG